METNKYEHYFDIDEEFFSAVNQQLIDEGKVDWHKFFPHETFVIYCIDCLAEYLGVTTDELRDKIEEFKEEGCTLFK